MKYVATSLRLVIVKLTVFLTLNKLDLHGNTGPKHRMFNGREHWLRWIMWLQQELTAYLWNKWWIDHGPQLDTTYSLDL